MDLRRIFTIAWIALACLLKARERDHHGTPDESRYYRRRQRWAARFRNHKDADQSP